MGVFTTIWLHPETLKGSDTGGEGLGYGAIFSMQSDGTGAR